MVKTLKKIEKKVKMIVVKYILIVGDEIGDKTSVL